MKLICFIVGVILGANFGLVLTALFVASGNESRKEEALFERGEPDERIKPEDNN